MTEDYNNEALALLKRRVTVAQAAIRGRVGVDCHLRLAVESSEPCRELK